MASVRCNCIDPSESIRKRLGSPSTAPRWWCKLGRFVNGWGQVEVHEKFIRQKARNMHRRLRTQKVTGIGKDKMIVVGVVERTGVVRTTLVESRKKKPLEALVALLG
jgi:hypothetical protein